MDPDFGIRTWYLKPTFFVKIIWALMSVAALIYEIVLISMDLDKYFKNVVGNGSGVLAVFVLIFTIISSACNVFYYFRTFPHFGKIVLYTGCGATAITLIFGIIYAAVYGSTNHEQDVMNTINNYNLMHGGEPLAEWYDQHIGTAENLKKYVDHRCTGAGEALLGLLITWFILQGLLLFIFLQENDYVGLGNIEPVKADSNNAPLTEETQA